MERPTRYDRRVLLTLQSALHDTLRALLRPGESVNGVVRGLIEAEVARRKPKGNKT